MDKRQMQEMLDKMVGALLGLSQDEQAECLVYLLEMVDARHQERTGSDRAFTGSIVTVLLALSHRVADGVWAR